tara:strand:- start:1278 stop:4253 length:2976 start_codon:yes stop_codon:yes gene_type:complete
MLGLSLNNKKTAYVFFGLVFFVFIFLPQIAQANKPPEAKDCEQTLKIKEGESIILNIDLSLNCGTDPEEDYLIWEFLNQNEEPRYGKWDELRSNNPIFYPNDKWWIYYIPPEFKKGDWSPPTPPYKASFDFTIKDEHGAESEDSATFTIYVEKEAPWQGCELLELGCIIKNFADSITGLIARIIFAGPTALMGLFGLITSTIFSGVAAFVIWILGVYQEVGITPSAGCVETGGPTPDAICTGWNFSRDFVNMFFILVLAFIGLSTILRLATYEAKKILPSLIIITLLINFSGVLVAFVVDMGNILTNFFISQANLATGFDTEVSFLTEVDSAYKGGSSDPSYFAGLMSRAAVSSIFYIIATLIYLAIALLFFFRIIILWVLTILAPFAFLSYIFPSTRKSAWNTWLKNLIQWSFIGVPIGFFMYLSSSLMDAKILADQSQVIGGNMGSLLGSMFSPMLSLAMLGIGVLIALKFAPAGADKIMNYGKRGGMMAARGTAFGMKLAGKYAGRKMAPRTELFGQKLKTWGKGKGIDKGFKRIGGMVPGGRWAARKLGTATEMAGREVSGRIGRSDKEAIMRAKEELMKLDAPELLNRVQSGLGGISGGIPGAPNQAREALMLALAEKDPTAFEAAVKNGDIEEKDVLKSIGGFSGRKQTNEAASLGQVLSDETIESIPGLKEKFEDGEKLIEKSRTLPSKEKLEKDLNNPKTFSQPALFSKLNDQLNKGEYKEAMEEMGKNKKIEAFADFFGKMTPEQLIKSPDSFLDNGKVKEMFLHHASPQQMGAIVSKGKYIANSYQEGIDKTGFQELAKRNPRVLSWLNSNPAQQLGIGLPKDAPDKLGKKEFRDEIKKAFVATLGERNKKKRYIEESYDGKEQMMLRDIYRKETSNMKKELLKEIIKREGINLPSKTIIDTKIGKTEKEFDSLSESLRKAVKNFESVNKKYKDAGSPLSGDIFNSYKAARKYMKEAKNLTDTNQAKLLQKEEIELKDLWK